METKTILTDFEPLAVYWTENGLHSVCLGEQASSESRQDFPYPEISDYLRGEVVDFSHYKLDLTDYSPFSKIVLQSTRKIPYGKLITYAELARLIKKPKAYRAVGSALGRNRYPLVIPCHRVIAGNGKPGGFSAGLGWKHFLIHLEKKHGYPLKQSY